MLFRSPQTEDFRLDASQPSLFDAEPSALRERLERRRARILLVLTPRDGLRRAGWTAVGPVGRHTLYVRGADPLRVPLSVWLGGARR